MEREVGSKFEFRGNLLRVEENRRTNCSGCFMFKHNLPCGDNIFSVTGYCLDNKRSDNKDVIFVEINNMKMTKEEIRKILDNTKVYVNGKSLAIQEKLFSFGYDWNPINHRVVKNITEPFLFIDKNGNITHGNNMYFFKMHENREITADEILSLEITEPYRPFKTKEECWDEMNKHQPFGWLYHKERNAYETINSSIDDTTGFRYFFNLYTFADGTPFGILEK